MELNANGLHIRIDPITSLDSEDWVRVKVVVSDAGFGADFKASLQNRDVEQFEKELLSMYEGIGMPMKAEFHCLETGISIELESDHQGHIDGRYEFINDTASGPILSGTFEIDQSYLPHWIRECRQFSVELRA